MQAPTLQVADERLVERINNNDKTLPPAALEKTDRTVVIQNEINPEKRGTLAWNELAGATPDGYTIGITGIKIMLQPLYSPTKWKAAL